MKYKIRIFPAVGSLINTYSVLSLRTSHLVTTLFFFFLYLDLVRVCRKHIPMILLFKVMASNDHLFSEKITDFLLRKKVSTYSCSA